MIAVIGYTYGAVNVGRLIQGKFYIIVNMQKLIVEILRGRNFAIP